ncbi:MULTISPECIES: YcgJ family protein [Serratia]|nr:MULTISPECIES: YcgJ family protein [Serratia]
MLGLLWLVCTGLTVTADVAAGLHRTAPVFFPVQGVVCDRDRGFCADAWGLSMAETGRYLGQAALMRLMDAHALDMPVDRMRFVLSNGVVCDSMARTCWRDAGRRTPDPAVTRALYGMPAQEAGDAPAA